ncbi:hypothetical protein BV898_01999 [Hypsibius exemplaris]|uniref:Uncharacterized protein n=1 Tax=Hypsibius exemplaris TaxID=2072580 RepID=A0A1W0X9G9_HYPEX|nr:hypothetical protein BV898_01999 [Hypsibius exemplaris]
MAGTRNLVAFMAIVLLVRPPQSTITAGTNRMARAVSLSVQNTVGFAPRDILLESLESKTCFEVKSGEVILNTCSFLSPSSSQLFTLKDLDGQHFTISGGGATCLAFGTSANRQGVTPLTASSTGCTTDNAKFYLDNSADGQSFLLRQKGTGKCVTPAATSGANEALKLSACDRNDPRQFFRIFSKSKPRRFAPHPPSCSN